MIYYLAAASVHGDQVDTNPREKHHRTELLQTLRCSSLTLKLNQHLLHTALPFYFYLYFYLIVCEFLFYSFVVFVFPCLRV